MIKRKIIIYKIFITFFISSYSSLFGEHYDIELFSKYPIDTILAKNDINYLDRLYILPLKFWQVKSYNDPLLNCQFFPSCSNYCAENIYRYGFFKGSIKGFDRFFRCNENSIKKYKKIEQKDNSTNTTFLSDSFNDDYKRLLENKDLDFALLLSVIPGLGRIYLGELDDGILVNRYTLSSILLTCFFNKRNKKLLAYFSGYFSMVFWSTDIYYVIKLKKSMNKNY